MTSLENKIAAALSAEDTKPAVFCDLVIETEEHLSLNEKEIIATKVKMVDPLYPSQNAAIAKSALEKLQLEHDRLQNAIPILKQRYVQAERQQTFLAIRPRYNALVKEHDDCSEALGKLYCSFVEHVIPLLNKAAKLNAEIRQMNSETHAKGLTEFKTIPTIAEHLITKMVLPAGHDQNYWPDPKTANAFAVQWADAMAQAYSSPLRQAASSPDWAAARAIQDEAKEAEWARINALQERQQAEAKREFEQSKKVAR